MEVEANGAGCVAVFVVSALLGSALALGLVWLVEAVQPAALFTVIALAACGLLLAAMVVDLYRRDRL